MRIRVSQIGAWKEIMDGITDLSEGYGEAQERIIKRLATRFVEIVLEAIKNRRGIVNEADREQLPAITEAIIRSNIKVTEGVRGYVFAGIAKDIVIEDYSLHKFMTEKEFGVRGQNAIAIWRLSYERLQSEVDQIVSEEFSNI